MKKVTEFLLKYRNMVLLVVGVILAIAIVGTVFLVKDDDKINSDMISYLSNDFDTQKGLTFLKENFGIRGDAMVVVRGAENDEELKKSVEKIRKIDGVKKLIWAEDAETLDGIKKSLADLDINFENLNEEELLALIRSNDLLSGYAEYIKLLGITDMKIDATSLRDYLKRKIDNEDAYDYVLMIMLEEAPSTSASYAVMDSIKAELGDRKFAASGTTETSQSLMTDTLNDLPNFLIYAVIAAVVILLLFTPSFIDPVIVMLTLGVSIVISMGVNYLYPSISVISFATSAVLQLAITMDYSVFYMHTYKQNRKLLPAYDATAKSLPEAAGSIIASGLTTVGGFAALYFMRFRLGADIAGVLIKGVILSIVTILILQPIMTLLLDKAAEKTTHNFIGKAETLIKKKKPSFKGLKQGDVARPVAKFSVWARIAIVVIAAALTVPAFIGQSKLQYSYLKMYEENHDTAEKVLAAELGNQTIMAVPLDTVKGTHKEFIEKLKQAPNGKVSGVTGAFTTIDIDKDTLIAMLEILTDKEKTAQMERTFTNFPQMIKDPQVRQVLEEQGVDVAAIEELLKDIDFENLDITKLTKDLDLSAINTYFSKVNGKWYTLYTINIKGSTEDEAAMNTYRYIKEVRTEFFGNDGYSIGMLTGSYDLATTTPTDFMRVTIASIAIIFLIIAVLLRNPLKSILIVAIIELGIWLNLSLTYLLGENINFMVYIIISSVELGCTVDYAILMANTFERNRKDCKTGKECAIKSATEAIPAIFVSALIISAICVVVMLVSNNLIIKQLTGMLARGAAISFVLVAVVLPAVLSFFKTERKKVDYEAKLKELEAKTENKE